MLLWLLSQRSRRGERSHLIAGKDVRTPCLTPSTWVWYLALAPDLSFLFKAPCGTPVLSCLFLASTPTLLCRSGYLRSDSADSSLSSSASQKSKFKRLKETERVVDSSYLILIRIFSCSDVSQDFSRNTWTPFKSFCPIFYPLTDWVQSLRKTYLHVPYMVWTQMPR